MTSKSTPIILWPIETAIVSRLTYEKKSIVIANELDLMFNLTANDRKQVVFCH